MSFARWMILLLALTVASCGGSSVGPAQGSALDEPVADVSALYVRKCAGCHGAAGTDQAATSLASLDQMSRSDVEATIRFGGEQMPAFGDSLNDANIAAIVDYTIENLSP